MNRFVTTTHIQRYKRHGVQFEQGLMCAICKRVEAEPNSNYCSACWEILSDQAEHWYRPSSENERQGEEYVRNEHRLALFEAKCALGNDFIQEPFTSPSEVSLDSRSST